MNHVIKKIIFTAALTSCIAVMTTTGVFADSLLKYGSRGSSVTQLQTALKQEKYFNCNATGYYGSITKASVKKFQKANGLAVDGIAGPKTLGKLYGKNNNVASSQALPSRGESSVTQQTKEDLYWLSRIINAEAGAEPYEGKLAVGNVILNRVNSSDFPDTIKGVIFEYYKNIPQFSPVAEGTIYYDPNIDSINAAKEVLAGKNVVADSTYFFNPKKAEGQWIVKNKEYYKTIGDHAFYR